MTEGLSSRRLSVKATRPLERHPPRGSVSDTPQEPDIRPNRIYAGEIPYEMSETALLKLFATFRRSKGIP